MKKFLQIGVVAGIALGALAILLSTTVAQNSACSVLNCMEQGGSRWSIGGSVDILSGGDLDIESGGALKIAGVDVTAELTAINGLTASVADLNATTNFEETISATTSEVTIASGKTLDVPDGNFQIANAAVTASAAELNYTDVTTPGTAEATKAVTTDANLDVTAIRNLTLTGDVVVSAPTSGGDAGERNTLTANINMATFAFGTMTNGSTETIALFDDTPAGECAQVGGQTVTDDSSVVRVGTNSLKLAFEATPSTDEGVDCTISNDNFESNESIGFWFRTDTALTATGDLYLELDDDGGTDVQFDFPTVSTINQWTWIELDISTCATCDIVNGVKIFVDTTGATTLAGANVWFDFMYKWDADDEEAIGVDLIQDGVIGVVTWIAADGGSQVHDTTGKVENTDFFINYQSGNDSWVTLADLSTFTGFVLMATQ